jgi:hypothetical protein
MTPSWIEHVDLVQAILVGCIGLISWFTARTLKLVDRNQTELFNRITHLEREFYRLQGEHEANQVYRRHN